MEQAISRDTQEQPIATKKDHVIFLTVVFCFWFSTYIYIPVFGLYLEDIGFRYSLIGIILGSYGVTQILLRFPLGVVSDRLVGLRKQLLIFGFIMAFVSALLLVFLPSFIGILVARLLAGITAAMWVMATVLYSQYFRTEHASKAMSRVQFLTVFAQFTSMIISGYLVLYAGWTFPFWIAAVTAIVGLILAFQIKEVDVPTSKTSSTISTHVKETFHIYGLKTITFLSLVAHAILFITIFGFSPLYTTYFSTGDHAITILVCAFFIPHALASVWLMFYKVDVERQKSVLLMSFALSALLLVATPLANSLFFFSLIHAGIGLTLGVIFPLLLGMVIQLSSNGLKNSAMGFYQSFYAIGILGGPLVAGELADKVNLPSVFFFSGLLSIIGFIVLIFFKANRNEKRSL
ncbi:MFS transporter [Alkalihalobacillus sp. MEB130]|uniref:MFS transporter n=1 Tax=Alkalihalobacillus sp. MEB130 TaxID=2976704 RepID=UPI0028DDD744|nr:MFS transporter [Alkalihalobacillus sp. MEB130]MDT8861125.1 MFS transporter [Alkalihalobacillus sp. MEB130]